MNLILRFGHCTKLSSFSAEVLIRVISQQLGDVNKGANADVRSKTPGPLNAQWKYLSCALVFTSIEGFMDESSLKELWTRTVNTYVLPLPWCRFLWRYCVQNQWTWTHTSHFVVALDSLCMQKGYIRDDSLTKTMPWWRLVHSSQNVGTNQKNRFALADYRRTITRIKFSVKLLCYAVCGLLVWYTYVYYTFIYIYVLFSIALVFIHKCIISTIVRKFFTLGNSHVKISCLNFCTDGQHKNVWHFNFSLSKIFRVFDFCTLLTIRKYFNTEYFPNYSNKI